jgi:hypothetical protein
MTGCILHRVVSWLASNTLDEPEDGCITLVPNAANFLQKYVTSRARSMWRHPPEVRDVTHQKYVTSPARSMWRHPPGVPYRNSEVPPLCTACCKLQNQGTRSIRYLQAEMSSWFSQKTAISLYIEMCYALWHSRGSDMLNYWLSVLILVRVHIPCW